jgi:DNA-binding CsgD family transcriptional regulator
MRMRWRRRRARFALRHVRFFMHALPRTRAARWDSLTDSELTVVHLIAEGATNRSVAQKLQISPHTVKSHVHNAFAKLGITSRAQLTQLMRGSD